MREQFALAEPKVVELSFVLAREPRLEGPTCHLAGPDPLAIGWPTGVFEAAIEQVEVTDGRLRPVWGDRVWRLRLTTTSAVAEGDWLVTVG